MEAHLGDARAGVRMYYAKKRAKELVAFRLSMEQLFCPDIASIIGSFISGFSGSIDQQFSSLEATTVHRSTRSSHPVG